MTAREEILSRIRTALPGDPLDPRGSHATIERAYERVGKLDKHRSMELFLDRLIDYDTEIVSVESEAEIAGGIADALANYDQQRVLAPAEFPAAWLPANIPVRLDHQLSTEEIDKAESIVTTCEVAVASTGTIFLVHGGSQGRRAITLLPDHHVCVVRRDQVVETVPEAFAAIAGVTTRPITTISGPSATADIEMTRIRGVHGPRRLTVVLYGAL